MELSAEVKNNIEIKFVSMISEVLEIALGPTRERRAGEKNEGDNKEKAAT